MNWITAQLERRSEQITGTTRDSLAHSRRNTGEERIHWWHRVFGLRPISAAALALATVMVIIAVGLHLRDAWEPAVSPDAGAGPTVLRSEELAIVGPTGDLDQAPSELRWQAASNAVIYSVQLMEVDRTELWKAESSQTSVSLPPAVRARIVPGKPLLWQVTAKDAAGRIIAASQIQRFHVTIKALQRKD